MVFKKIIFQNRYLIISLIKYRMPMLGIRIHTTPENGVFWLIKFTLRVRPYLQILICRIAVHRGGENAYDKVSDDVEC